MIDPTTHCPRCDLPYIEGSREQNLHKHLRCITCSFVQFIDIRTRRKYAMSFAIDSMVHVNMTWVRADSGELSTVVTTNGRLLVIEEWLPFDITLEQLKLYLTFS